MIDHPLLVLTHLAAFLVGVATWLPATLWEGNRVTSGPPDTQEHPVDATNAAETPVQPTPGPPTHRQRRVPLLAAIALIVGAVLIGFGVQQGIYQHQQRVQHRHDVARTKCVATYNADVEQVRDDRLTINQTLADAQTAKDNAGDQVLLDALAYVQSPPGNADERATLAAELTRDLVVFARRKHHLDATMASTSTELKKTPYPTLDCP
jgi:uncharacterized protein HemX